MGSGTDATERPTRQFWGLIGDKVVPILGYECVPANPGFWWVPDLGYSQHQDYLHTTEKAALDAIIAERTQAYQAQYQILVALHAQAAKCQNSPHVSREAC